jgi:hypothetical protein
VFVGKYWRGFWAVVIVFWILQAFLFFVCALPYIIPVGQTQAEMSPNELVTEHGRFLDIDGVPIYVEEQNPESAQATIVFIHGLGGSTFSWHHNAPFFAG